MKNKTRLTAKDLILTGVLSIVMRIIGLIVGLPLMPLMAVAFPLVTGVFVLIPAPVYLIMANKVNKRGVMFVLCTVFGLTYLLMGFAYMIPYMLVAGVICEAIMWKQNSYRNILKNIIGYSVFSVLFIFAALLPIYLFGAEYMIEYGEEMMLMYERIAYSPLWTTVTLLTGAVMAAIGCLLGQIILKKHFIKSGIISAHPRDKAAV